MPRLKNAIPKYRKHKQSGQAIVTLCGRDYLLGPYGTRASKLEYDRLIAEWLVRGRQPAVDPESITVVELCIRYWKFADKYYRKNGRPTCLHGVKQAIKLVRESYGRQLAVEFGPLALKVVRQNMVDAGKSRRYINEQVDCIRRMFKWGAAEQLLPGKVYQSLATVSGLRKGRTEARETAPVTPVDDATVQATLSHLPAVVGDMVRFQRYTGCRPAEVCVLRPSDLDRSGEVWAYRPESHKTEHFGRRRVIFIGPQAQRVLLRYLARDAASFCFRPCDSEAKRRATAHAARKTPLSCGNVPESNRKRRPKRTPGDYYDVASYRRAIHRSCDRAFPWPKLAGREIASLTEPEAAELAKWRSAHRWSPNQLRHSAATEIRRRYGLEAAATVLGHAKADVTQIYAERDYALAARVAKEVG